MPPWFTPLLLALDALAVYRLTRLIVTDHMPFGPLRDRLARDRPHSLITDWMHCPWCSSAWIAAAVLAVHALTPHWWPYAAAVLAFSAVAGLLATWEDAR